MGRQGLPVPPQKNLPPDQISEGVPHQRPPPNHRTSPQQPNSRPTDLPNPHPEKLHLTIPHLSRSSASPLLSLHHSLLKSLLTPPSPSFSCHPSSSPLRPRPRRSPSPKPRPACPFLSSRLWRIRPSPHIRKDFGVCIRRGCYAWPSLGTRCRAGVVGEAGYLGPCYPCGRGQWHR